MDTGEEGFIEGLHAVRGEEEDTTVVFDMSKARRSLGQCWDEETRSKGSQDGHHGIPFQVMQRTLLQEHIGFVNENDSLPSSCDVENALQRSIQSAGGRPKVASADNVQRPLHVLAGRLGGEGLTDARGSEQIDNEAMAFALDEIVEAKLAVVRLDERLKQILSAIWENEVGEGVVIPFDFFNELDVKLHCIHIEAVSGLLLERINRTYARLYRLD